MELIFLLFYWGVGYWAINKVWYSKRVYIIHDGTKFFVQKACVAFAVGWIAIPIAVIMTIVKK